MKPAFIVIVLLAVALALYVSLLPNNVKDVKNGNRLYVQQKYDEALERYMQAAKKAPDSDIVNFNIGAALYKKGDFENIAAYFKKALLTEDKKLKEKTYYNLGNVSYKIAMHKRDEDLESTVGLLEQSLVEYAKALKLNKENEDAQYNYAYVKNLLDNLKEQLQEQQKNQAESPNKQLKPQIKPPQPRVKPSQPKTEPPKPETKPPEPQEKPPQPQGKPPEPQPKENQAQPPKPEQPEQPEQKDQSSENNIGQGKPGEKPPIPEKISEKEALIFLEGYKQKEEPQGLLNVLRQKKSSRSVLKDW